MIDRPSTHHQPRDLNVTFAISKLLYPLTRSLNDTDNVDKAWNTSIQLTYVKEMLAQDFGIAKTVTALLHQQLANRAVNRDNA